MTDHAFEPAPVTAPAPFEAVEPWQARLEVLSLLLVICSGLVVLGRLVNSYYLARQVDPMTFLMEPVDWVEVVRVTGQSLGVFVAGAVLVSYLLVTLGPGQRISQRGVLVLRLDVIVGFVAAGVAGFTTFALLFQDSVTDFTGRATTMGATRDFAGKIGAAAPVAMATAIALYVAWCAFSTLGEAQAADGDDELDEPVDPGTPDAGWAPAPAAAGPDRPLYPAAEAKPTDGSEWAPPPVDIPPS